MKKRLIFLMVCFVLVLGALTVRLTYIQLINNDEFASVTARQQRITLEGGDSRGTIYDRNMAPLTGAVDDYIYIIEKGRMDAVAAKIFHHIGAERAVNNSLRYYVYRSNRFNEDAAYVLKRDYQVFMIKSARRYAKDQPAVHLIGYINETDGNGSCGIERDFNEILKKTNKVVYASADGKRMIIPGLGINYTVESPDCGVITTLDMKIQKRAEEILHSSGYSGSLIVLDAKNGEILASASTPAFHPYNIEEYLDSTNQEFINKATQSQYPPGSIFKIIVAAAALEKGVVTPETLFTCKGYEEINGIKIKCSAGGEDGHGTITFREAFAKSCNSTFIQIGMMTGGQDILDMAKDFGIGEKALPDISEEKAGNLPGIEDVQGAGIGNLSIGQGKLLVTPIQAARVTSIIASGGVDYGLKLVKATVDEGIRKETEQPEQKRILSEETADMIKNLMVDTVNFGTANNLSDLGVSIAGKTGSAEASYFGEMVVHGWFTGFLPADNPQYVITVFVESGGSGRSSAVPLFQQMVQYLN